MEVFLINSYLTKVSQMIYNKYPLLISFSRLVRKFHYSQVCICLKQM